MSAERMNGQEEVPLQAPSWDGREFPSSCTLWRVPGEIPWNMTKPPQSLPSNYNFSLQSQKRKESTVINTENYPSI